MNNLIKILCTVSLIATSFSIKADNETPKLDGPVSSTLLKKETVSSQRPRTLGDMFITCYYNNECIEVEFPADAECMEVTISNESVSVWSGIITCDAPTCDIPQLVGQYIITCTTDNGLVYQGLLSF